MKIKICNWKACQERFSSYIKTRLLNDKEKFDLKDLEIEETPCMWNCKKWPNIKIDNELFHYMNPAKASELLFKKLKNVKSKKHKN